MTHTRVLLADDHRIMLNGLQALLANVRGVQVVGEASDGRSAVQLALKLLPDVVVMDVSMPDLNGMDATRQIRARAPKIKVIALSMHSDERFVAGMFKAGVTGYLIKDGAFEELANAIEVVKAGQSYISPRIARVLVDQQMRGAPSVLKSDAPLLSAREREVLQLIAEGVNTKEIGARLQISVKTVETHRKRIMDRLGLHSVAELTKYAVREGLTSLEG